MADGSIIIDTRIDTGGVSKGMNAVKAGMARISAQVSKMGDSAKSSFQRQITAITGLYQNYEKQERKVSELVDNVDWKLLGRTVGAGINTIVNTLNLLITGIDWKNLGKKFAEGITGLVKEVNWNNLGQLIANRFMITWDIFNGMVHNLPFSEIGKAIADGLNGICSRISFREIADTLATGLNGAFTTLYSFTRRFDWTGLVNNIAGGINTFISEFDWKNNGRKLEVFLNSLCSSLVDMAEKTDWEALGQGIGEMLGQINWVKHLKQVITAITRTLGGLFDVLEASGTAGKIAAFLGKAFIAVKIADITGIGSLVKFLVTTIGKKLITEESVQALAGNISNLTNSALAGSTSGIATFASSLGSLVGTAGAITLVTAGTVMLTKKIAELVETAQGGNGILTQTGGYLHDYAGKMGEAHAITNKQVEELWALVEADETAGKSNSEMYDSRKIVREETAGRQAGGGSYRFTAQINRRTLFDEMMKEAQMRRDTSGRNPFEMA